MMRECGVKEVGRIYKGKCEGSSEAGGKVKYNPLALYGEQQVLMYCFFYISFLIFFFKFFFLFFVSIFFFLHFSFFLFFCGEYR